MQKITLGKLRTNLQKLTLPVVQELTADIIVADKKIIARKRDEFKAGFNPDGSRIGIYQSESYRIFKMEKNPFADGYVDLILTGSLKEGLKVEHIGDGKYILLSTDSKWEELQEKYGEQIQLINEEHFARLQKVEYAPQLIKAMRRLSGL